LGRLSLLEKRMKLYTKPGACSLADHIVLRWIGEPFEVQVMDAKSLKAREYLHINPAGNVPALQDGDWLLTQNAAILNYLAERFPGAGLAGDGTAKGRAETNRWLAFLNADVHTSFHPLFGATGYLDDASAIERSKQHARTKLRGLFERIDTQLKDKDWLTGSRSVVDPYLFVILRWAKDAAVDLSGLQELARFFERMTADPDVVAAMAAEGLQ